jgi:hypothetical protein
MTIAGLRRDERSDEECDHQRQSGDEETHCDFSVSFPAISPHPKSVRPTRADFGACLSRRGRAIVAVCLAAGSGIRLVRIETRVLPDGVLA